jgi:ADP-heptose:LPS heptosyltransferase
MKVIIEQYQSPGDVVAMTGAIRDLKNQYPDYEIKINTSCPDVFKNNPYITHFENSEANYKFYLDYNDIHNSGKSGRHFSQAFHISISEKLNINLKQSAIWPDIHIGESDNELKEKIKQLINIDKFWILNAGFKCDYPLKHWGTENYQKVVDILKGKVTFVQVGESSNGHMHLPLDGTIDIIGKTSLRELIVLSSMAQGSCGPVSAHMHIMAAFEKPSVIIAGGREPYRWEAYPNHRYLHTNGLMKCCEYDGCWKGKLECQVGLDEMDAEGEWKKKCCINVNENGTARCMDLIKPELVADQILAYYEGGICA